MEKSKSPRWLSVTEAARHVSASPGKIRQMLRAGELTRHKLGTKERCRVLVSVAELDRYVEAHTLPANPRA